jgi:hypothetical protein
MNVSILGTNTNCTLVAIRTGNTASIGNYRTQACDYTTSDRSSLYTLDVASGTAAISGKQLTINLSGSYSRNLAASTETGSFQAAVSGTRN